MRKLTDFYRVGVGVLSLTSMLVSTHGIAGEKPGYPFSQHIDQHTIHTYPIDTVYDWGKQLFEAPYNSLDGVGLNLSGDPVDAIRMRFSRIPRADLPGWLADPIRLSGPTARNCRECHNSLSGNMLNTVFDFSRQGNISLFAERQTPNIAGVGAIQLLAEQTSQELWAIRDDALASARATQQSVSVELLTSNNISYGHITAHPDGSLDTSDVHGVGDQDNPFLFASQFQVVPFFSKGEVGFLRITSANPPNGMQSPEQYPEDLDADGDGVVGEMSTGDITAITVYIASQPRPITKLELHEHVGGKFKLSDDEIGAIEEGAHLFDAVGCNGCHQSELRLTNATFNEPSSTPGFSLPFFSFKYIKEDGTFGFTSPLPYGYDPANPVSFDLANLPSIACDPNKDRESDDDNDVHDDDHQSHERSEDVYRSADPSCWRQFESAQDGSLIIRAYTDLKRHEMGQGLAEDVVGFGGLPGSVWKTKELWGIGSTGPWLHDGRATTLTNAIKWHGGEAQQSSDHFFALSESAQDNVIAFLQNLVIYDAKRNAIQPSGNGFAGESNHHGYGD